MGDMNPFWQTLDSVFGAYFNATTNETDSAYTTFFHPVSSQRCDALSERFTASSREADFAALPQHEVLSLVLVLNQHVSLMVVGVNFAAFAVATWFRPAKAVVRPC